MNPIEFQNELTPDERETALRLAKTAENLQPAGPFVNKTEARLREVFLAKKENQMQRTHLLWQTLAGAVAVILLALAVNWLVKSMAPQVIQTPMPANNSTQESGPAPVKNTAEPTATTSAPTSTSPAASYDWHGTQINFSAAFPQLPGEAALYTHSAATPATSDSARALAARFGIQGEVYLDNSGINGPKIYLVTDGKQRLSVISAEQFRYYANYSQAFVEAPVSPTIASGAIDVFLKAHGYDFEYWLEAATGVGAGWFYVLPIMPDGQLVRFDFGLAQRLEIHVDPSGQIISLDSYLLNVDPQPVGQFGLISAEAAWQKFLSDAPFGFLQSSHSGSSERYIWYRAYPNNQPVTFRDNVTVLPSVESSQPPLILLGEYVVSGNMKGLENVGEDVVVKATGQFIEAEGIRKFQVETWEYASQLGPSFLPENLTGNVRKEGGRVIFQSEGQEYVLENAPVDLPLSGENLIVSGYPTTDGFDWQTILYFPNSNGGGGGGCGGSLAKLNLSGTPVAWPTAVVTAGEGPIPGGPTAGQHLAGVHGQLMVTIYEKLDGSQRTEYGFSTQDAYYLLEGDNLQPLDAYQNRPVVIWGTVKLYNPYTMVAILTVERYEIPFPDLKFQILRGKQKLIDVNGQQVTLFTAQDGKSYVQLMPAGQPDNSLVGVAGDLVEYEALVIPDETFGSYPAMRVFSGGMITDQPMEITADQPYVMPEPQPNNSPAPVLTIDSIELAYYTPDPRNYGNNPDAMSPYIQPVWRFHGHYGDGSEMEILIQALKPEFLFPEPAYTIQCG